jgi:Bacteriophage tail sheath protein
MRYSTPGVYIERLDQNPHRIGLRRTDIAGFVGVAVRGPLHRPVKIESLRQFTSVFGPLTRTAYLAWAVSGFFENGGRECWVVRAADPLQARAARIRLFVNGEGPFALEASSAGEWGNDVTLEAVWGQDRITHVITRTPDHRQQILKVSELVSGPQTESTRDNLAGLRDADIMEIGEPSLVRVVRDAAWMPTAELDARTRRVRLTGGEDGITTLTTAHLLGSDQPDTRWGLAALEREDAVCIVAVPDLMKGQDPVAEGGTVSAFGPDQIRDAQLEIIASCERRRDRVAVLDLPPGLDPTAAIDFRAALTESSYAALYYPWILVSDSLRGGGAVRAVPPSGQVAGIYARTDRLRGVHKPPANETVEGACDAARHVDGPTHGWLNDDGINVIRPVPGRGLLLLGVRTLSRDIRWRYVNVRRLFALIEEALDEQMQWAVFEPNSTRLWGEIDRVVRGYLEGLYRRGMLDGGTSDEAYFVKCDASVNPPFETDAGKVTCLVGLQPPFPAEFVIVRIGVTRSGIEIEERSAHDV